MIIHLESTEAAFKRMKSLFTSGQVTEIGGLRILDVHEAQTSGRRVYDRTRHGQSSDSDVLIATAFRRWTDDYLRGPDKSAPVEAVYPFVWMAPANVEIERDELPKGLAIRQCEPAREMRSVQNPESRIADSRSPLIALRTMAVEDILIVGNENEWFAPEDLKFGKRFHESDSDESNIGRSQFEAGWNRHSELVSGTDLQAYQAFAQFHAALAKRTTLLHRQSLLADCLGTLIMGYGKESRRIQTPTRRGLERARDFMEEHLAEKISLSQLAAIAGLSRYHFMRAFTHEFGLPPHAYQTSIRIAKVRQLLRAQVPMALIDVGFSDQSSTLR